MIDRYKLSATEILAIRSLPSSGQIDAIAELFLKFARDGKPRKDKIGLLSYLSNLFEVDSSDIMRAALNLAS